LLQLEVRNWRARGKRNKKNKTQTGNRRVKGGKQQKTQARKHGNRRDEEVVVAGGGGNSPNAAKIKMTTSLAEDDLREKKGKEREKTKKSEVRFQA
jgi:hypothetical protein